MRITDLLAPLGVVVIIAAKAVELNGHLPGQYWYYLAGGLALVAAHVVLRWDDIVGALGARQMMYGGNLLVLGLAVLGVLGLLNYLASRNSKRWDLTKSKIYSLSEQGKKVVSGLKDDVTIYYFQRSAEVGPGRDRLEQMQHLSSKLKVEFVDPIATPITARQFEVTSVPTLVVVRGEKKERIGNDSEQDVVNALIKVTRSGKKTICFVTGEGERGLDDFGPTGLNNFKEALGKSQYETKQLLLEREPKVPEDCTLAVVAGPQKDLGTGPVEALRSYVKAGGRALFMVEPEFNNPIPNLTALLKEWNLEAGDDLVVDISLRNQLSNTGAETPLADRYPPHEITKDFRPATAFHSARSVKATATHAAGIMAQNLVETSEDSWAEKDYRTETPKVSFNEGKDQRGPISLGAVAMVTVSPSPSPSPSPSASPSASPEAEPPRKEGRVVAFGDVDFISNQLLGFIGNGDFALNTVAWLAEDPDLISIRPKDAEEQRLFPTQGQGQMVLVLALLILPGLFLVLGAMAWWGRRS
jgi:gliding motility-associatede transport system auxiliary component